MNPKEEREAVEHGGFFLLLALVTVAFIWIAWPFAAPLLWAALAAIMFHPMQHWFEKRLRGRNRAALASLLVIFVAVIVPGFLIGSAVVDQAAGLVLQFREGQIDIPAFFDRVHDALPANIRSAIDASGLGDFSLWQERAQEFATESIGLIAQQAIALGGSLFGFVLAFGVGLYVSYFLLRDGDLVGKAIMDAVPLERDLTNRLAERFITIVKATIKGSVVVGLVQGALGAITFWIVGVPAALLLGVLMAFASLIPAVGAGLIWVPVAITLLALGEFWQAIVVVVSGVAVIGLADNLLRPILVGRDTGIPDWLVLITTLGGIALLGLSGIVLGPLVAGLFLATWTIQREHAQAAGA